jgi:hypothetical protein
MCVSICIFTVFVKKWDKLILEKITEWVPYPFHANTAGPPGGRVPRSCHRQSNAVASRSLLLTSPLPDPQRSPVLSSSHLQGTNHRSIAFPNVRTSRNLPASIPRRIFESYLEYCHLIAFLSTLRSFSD